MGARCGVDRRLDESTATLTFIYEQNNNGMQSILFKYDNVTDKLYVASSINHNSGGGSSRIGGLYSFIRSRTFSPTRFGVLLLCRLHPRSTTPAPPTTPPRFSPSPR